jgi:3-carboxy-cis,cis-muconate cycloisomerase
MSRLIDSLATTDALAEIFSDRSVLQAMLDVEAALADASARAGLIPERAARAIRTAARAEHMDATAIAREAGGSATPSIPLVRALRELVARDDEQAARYVHWGATSQDVSDSALVLLLARAQRIVARDHARLEAALRDLSEAHADTVMLGRTLMQPATPVTFGLKVAGWYAAIARSWARLSADWTDALTLQLGGASGTRAAFAGQGSSIAHAMAAQLGVAAAPPWHAARDRQGAFIASCGLYTAALAKAARDITLLMQAEVAEVSERGGGSSAMPHKRNPAGSVVVLAAAARLPGLVSSFMTAMVQEHERAAGGSQAEWPIVAAAVQGTGAAAHAMATVIERLSVDRERMRANLEATGGAVFSERVVMLLVPAVGREAAQELVARALDASWCSRRAFVDVVRSMPEIAGAIPPDTMATIDSPEHYLGEAEALRRELLGGDPPGARASSARTE